MGFIVKKIQETLAINRQKIQTRVLKEDELTDAEEITDGNRPGLYKNLITSRPHHLNFMLTYPKKSLSRRSN